MSPSSKYYNGNATTTEAIKQQRNTRAPAASSLALSPTSSIPLVSQTSLSSLFLPTDMQSSSSLCRNVEDEQVQLLPTSKNNNYDYGTNNNSKTTSSTTATKQVLRAMPSFKIISYQNMIALLTVLVCGLATVNGLKCYMCGQYNEGVGSITPCTNYSDQHAHLYLKECSKKSEKYCVKYVSELSTVRDCATECAEKEIWETQTYCCTEDGCNGSSSIEATTMLILTPIIAYLCNAIWNAIMGRR